MPSRIAREGIEYAWGAAKDVYRRLPIQEKQQKDHFLASVKKCIDPVNTLSPVVLHKYSRQARQYIVAYAELDKENTRLVSDQDGNDYTANRTTNRVTLTMAKIEKMIKCYKTHRSAIDFDKSFIARAMSEQQQLLSNSTNTTSSLTTAASTAQRQQLALFAAEIARSCVGQDDRIINLEHYVICDVK